MTTLRNWRSVVAITLYGLAVAGLIASLVSAGASNDGDGGVLSLLGILIVFLAYATGRNAHSDPPAQETG